MKQVIVVKPKSISPKDKAKLSKAGHLVIEHENPNEVRMLEPESTVPVNEMLKCAIAAIAAQDITSVNSSFIKRLNKVINQDTPTTNPTTH